MKNKILKTFLIVVVITLPIYLAGAFYSVSFNIADWSEPTRVFVSIFGVIGALLPIVISLVEESSPNK